MSEETDIEDIIAQCIKDYFLDNHEFETDRWDGFVVGWMDTSEFDAQALAENIIERLRQSKTVILNVP